MDNIVPFKHLLPCVFEKGAAKVIHGGVIENRHVAAISILVFVQVTRCDNLVTFAKKTLLRSDDLVRGLAVASDHRLVLSLSEVAVDDCGFLFPRIQTHIIRFTRQQFLLLLLQFELLKVRSSLLGNRQRIRLVIDP